MRLAQSLKATTRLGVFLIVIGGAATLGVFLAHAVLVTLAETGVLCLLVCKLYAVSGARSIRLVREHAPYAADGEIMPVTLRVRQGGALPLPLVEVEDAFAPDPEFSRRHLVEVVPPRGREAVVRYSARCARGRGSYRIGPAVVTVSDPFGFFRESRTLDVMTTVAVLPRVEAAGELPLRVAGAVPAGPSSQSRLAGQSAMFHGTREYRPGDPFRRIHWRASARHQRWILREFEEERAVDTTIYLDLDGAARRGVGRASNFETAVRIVASLVSAASEQGHPVRLIAKGESAIRHGPGLGPGFVLATLDVLAHVRATGTTPLASLVENTADDVPHGGAALMVLSTRGFDPGPLSSASARWIARGVRPIAILLDDEDYMRLEWGTLPTMEWCTGFLASHGIETYRHRRGEALAALFHARGVA